MPKTATPKPKLTPKVKRMIQILSDVEKESAETLKEFTRRFCADAGSALIWADPTFEAAALGACARTLRIHLQAGVAEDRVFPWILERVLQMSRRSTSSSTCRNFMDRCEGLAWTKIYEKLKFESLPIVAPKD